MVKQGLVRGVLGWFRSLWEPEVVLPATPEFKHSDSFIVHLKDQVGDTGEVSLRAGLLRISRGISDKMDITFKGNVLELKSRGYKDLRVAEKINLIGLSIESDEDMARLVAYKFNKHMWELEQLRIHQ